MKAMCIDLRSLGYIVGEVLYLIIW